MIIATLFAEFINRHLRLIARVFLFRFDLEGRNYLRDHEKKSIIEENAYEQAIYPNEYSKLYKDIPFYSKI